MRQDRIFCPECFEPTARPKAREGFRACNNEYCTREIHPWPSDCLTAAEVAKLKAARKRAQRKAEDGVRIPRYKIDYTGDENSFGDAWKNDGGQWCRASDVAALEAKLAAMVAERDALTARLERALAEPTLDEVEILMNEFQSRVGDTIEEVTYGDLLTFLKTVFASRRKGME